MLATPVLNYTTLSIRWGQNRTNIFAAAKGGKSAMRPLDKLLWTIVFFSYFKSYPCSLCLPCLPLVGEIKIITEDCQKHAL